MANIAVVLNYPLSQQIKVGHLDILKIQFENMLKLFDEVHVISPRDKEEYEFPDWNINITIHSIKPSMIKYMSPFKEARYLRKLIEKEDVKIIRAMAASSGYTAIRASHGRVPVIVSMHTNRKFYEPYLDVSEFKKRLLDRIEPEVYCNADLVPVVEEFYGNRCKELGVKEDRIMLHYNFVDLDKFKPMKSDLNTNKKVLVFVGRLDPEKNVGLIINMFAELLKHRQDVLLKIAGVGSEMDKLKLLSRDLHIADKVEFLGKVAHSTELPLLYQTSDVLVGSISAGFSLIEGLACGLPAVCGNVEWHPEIIKNGENGYLCDCFNPKDFAQAILKALDKENYYKLSINARQTAVDKFSLEDWKVRELRMYEKAINFGK